MDFTLESEYQPTGDQPTAIKQLVQGLKNGEKHQTLLGVTGSGKTFTMANVVKEINKPTLVLSHNKTLAAQLYGEFKQFFPNNAVEYFVSYYDYYQPEAYIPTSDTFIEKDLSINDEIEKLRLSTTSSLLSGRKDVLVVASVSCIYGIGNPEDFSANVLYLEKGQIISRNAFLHQLVDSLYSRTTGDFQRGNFRVKGDTVDVYLAYADHAFRFTFWGDEIESIEAINPVENIVTQSFDSVNIYPANIFVTTKESMKRGVEGIQADLIDQVEYFKEIGKTLEAKRLDDRTNYDLEMMRELGYCSGIENYSRYFDGRKPGSRPFCLIDYFPDDFLMFIDDNVVMVDSVSKRYSMCGARVGALISKNKEMMKTALKFAQARLSPPTFGQIAAEAALETGDEYFAEVIEEYVARRNIMVSGLNKIEGVTCPNPGGAFYCMVEFPVKNSDHFCEWLIRDFEYQGHTVMLAPGTGFYSNPSLGETQARVAYVLEKEKLELAIVILEKALEAYPETTR